MASLEEASAAGEAEGGPAEAEVAGSARAAELLKKAEELKAAGNELFKAKEYKKALTRFGKIRSYTWLPTGQAAQYGHGHSAAKDYSDADIASITRLDQIACGNMAQCHLELGDYRKALEFSGKVFGNGASPEEQDSSPANVDLHVKALNRSAQCAMRANDLDSSKAFVQRALALDAKSAPARATYKQLQAAYKAYNAERKKAMASAFARA